MVFVVYSIFFFMFNLISFMMECFIDYIISFLLLCLGGESGCFWDAEVRRREGMGYGCSCLLLSVYLNILIISM